MEEPQAVGTRAATADGFNTKIKKIFVPLCLGALEMSPQPSSCQRFTDDGSTKTTKFTKTTKLKIVQR